MDSEVKTRVTRLDDVASPTDQTDDCLVVYYSADPKLFGQRQPLSAAGVSLGRGLENTVIIESDNVSRRHAKIEQRGADWVVFDLGSTNGTYVNDIPVVEHTLRRGDQIKIGNTILKYLSGSDVEAQYHETIYKMTILDGLTDAYNKRFLLEALDREVLRARRYDRAVSLLMIDVDFFKNVNDTFGHLAGDQVLKEVAAVLKQRLRPDDTLGRYGGEEFAVVLPETNVEAARLVADDLRRRIESHPFICSNKRVDITVSIGVAELATEMDVTTLLRNADEKLYQSKRSGRNRVS